MHACKRLWLFPAVLAMFAGLALLLADWQPVRAGHTRQATATGLPSQPSAIINTDQEQVNVRAGPSVEYAKVGVLLQNQRVIILGRTPGGDWVQIVYPNATGGVAWVYAYVLQISGGPLPVVEPPPTPTPLTTPTIDPTLASQFVIQIPPTRLPTFTPPPPLVIPTYPTAGPVGASTSTPLGIIIIVLAALGLLGLIVAVLRGL